MSEQVWTKYGWMPAAALWRKTIVWNNAHEAGERVEYHYQGEEVRSDVSIALKEVPSMFGEQGVLDG